MIIWLIGLSGAGKTEIGKHIYEIWKKEAPNTVLVDGDEIRKIFQHDRGNEPYTIEGRRKNAERICELCAWLDRQKINVICCILSIFEESRQWNRQHYSKYFETYISVPMEVLRKRDRKGLYEPAFRGELKNVVGVDINFVPPKNPDYIFDNEKEDSDLKLIASDILSHARKN